tara:strand:+ start:225 stop:1175 length:951 start_codon:yes stop_codon:yes gene_type:complete
LIKLESLSKNYGDIKAVKSISFNLSDKEIVGFLGANGAGKSTTLKMITGYLTPTSGDVYINGMDISENNLEVQKLIGYLPELNPLYTEMKVYDYLKFHADIRAITGKDFKQNLERVVIECGLKGVIHRTVGNCSKGYKQRIGLAAAMIHNPKILILDEPVTGLDPNQIVEIRRLIKKLGQEKLVLMSSHILQEIQATVDRIIIIHNGEIVADGTNDELISDSKGMSELNLEIQNCEEDSINEIKAVIPSLNVKSVNKINKETFNIVLEYPSSTDLRKDVFDYCIKNKWIILEMKATVNNLEDIFMNLTKDGDKVNA